MTGKWMKCMAAAWLSVLIWASAAADEIYVETPLTGATQEQRANIALAVQAMDGVRLSFGERFSFNELVGERSAERGFVPAKNGRGVNVVGGGVAQTATTLYLALMQRDDIEYSRIYTYNENFVGSYVESGYDAVVTDYVNGLDFAFSSYYEGMLTIYMWMTEEALCCFVSEGNSGALWDEGYAEMLLPEDAACAVNVMLAADSITGCRLEPGESFSFNELVGPRSAEAGYQLAQNGRGVDVVGGGVAQVASAVYLAVKELDEVTVLEKKSYGEAYVGDYVDDAEDAVLVDYAGDIDFSFVNEGDGALTIFIYSDEERIMCEICGE